MSIGVAEADFQAVAHAVAGLGHLAALSELLMCSAGCSGGKRALAQGAMQMNEHLDAGGNLQRRL